MRNVNGNTAASPAARRGGWLSEAATDVQSPAWRRTLYRTFDGRWRQQFIAEDKDGFREYSWYIEEGDRVQLEHVTGQSSFPRELHGRTATAVRALNDHALIVRAEDGTELRIRPEEISTLANDDEPVIERNGQQLRITEGMRVEVESSTGAPGRGSFVWKPEHFCLERGEVKLVYAWRGRQWAQIDVVPPGPYGGRPICIVVPVTLIKGLI
jgi:hypothetical protein